MRELDLSIEDVIGYTFENKNLCIDALTHSSYLNENKGKNSNMVSNERLEFLGDAVLQLIISSELYSRFPNMKEGYLTNLRKHIVCGESLVKISNKLMLDTYLYIGNGEQKNGFPASILENVLESLIAAVFLDSKKNLDVTSKFVLRLFKDTIDSATQLRGGDYISLLQQFIQNDGESIQYILVSEDGPSNDPTYVYQVIWNNNILGTGRGNSKSKAKQNAAKEALILFGIIKGEDTCI